MRIQHNISALNSWGKLGINQNNAAKNLEKLSSGYRINRAGDDAAGLAISEKMRGQIRGLDMASKNAQDGISLIQTAEGALDETHSILQRMRELAVQSANGTYQDEDRANTDLEVQALKSELDRIANSTHFNKIQLLDGSLAAGSTKGAAGKAAAKVSVSDTALSNNALTINKAQKGIYETNLTGNSPLSAIQAGATNEYTISYTDEKGKTQTETVSMRFDSVEKKIYDANGGQLLATAGDNATVGETVEALKSALEKSGLGDKFKIEMTKFNKQANDSAASESVTTGVTKADATGLKFTAKEAGSASPAITSIVQTSNVNSSKIVANTKVTSDHNIFTLDLNKIDLNKIKAGDTLMIGTYTINFANAGSGGTTAKATAGTNAGATIFIDNVNTIEDLAGAFTVAFGTQGATATTADNVSVTLASNNTAAYSIALGGTGGNGGASLADGLLELKINGATLGGDGNGHRDDLEKIMMQFKYTSNGESIRGGTIGIGNDAGSYAIDTVQSATDRYESYDLNAVGVWNPGNPDDDIADHIFEVNGEKFLMVKQNSANQVITDDSISKATAIYGNELNVITLHTASTSTTEGSIKPTVNDVINVAERIKEKTGTDVRANGTKLDFLATAGTSGKDGDGKLVFQIGANGSADQRVSMSIEDMSSKGIGVDKVDIKTTDTANKAIDIIDQAINTVSGTRANLGAMQNRLEHTINSLNTSSENLTAAESRIRDVDMAKEMMAFTKNNILTQAAQAMLAQANQQPQGVLQLLQ